MSKLNLSANIFRYLCKQIDSGSPLWALATANEYLSPKSPLHKALCAKARASVLNQNCHALGDLESGVKMCALTDDCKRLVATATNPSYHGKNEIRARFIEHLKNRSAQSSFGKPSERRISRSLS